MGKCKKNKKYIKENIDKLKKSMKRKDNLDKKVELIKRLIQKGEYSIPPEDIAKKMLEYFAKVNKNK
jgi:anti-sigma28 factor (negative regulator of flagellin synthesis)